MDGKEVVHIYIIVVHIYNIWQYYSAEIKKSSNAICSNMNAIRDYHPKGSKPEKER